MNFYFSFLPVLSCFSSPAILFEVTLPFLASTFFKVWHKYLAHNSPDSPLMMQCKLNETLNLII